MQDCGDGAGEDSSIYVDEVGKVCIIGSCVDLMDDGTFDEVADVELAYIIMVLADGVLDMVLCVSLNVGGQCWLISQAVGCGRGVNMGICGNRCNKTKMS